MAMHLGISSYCLSRKLYSKEWTLFDIMDWAKAHECTHMEIVPFGLPLFKEDGAPDLDFARQIADHADKIGLPLSAFSLNACVIRPGDEEEQGSASRERNVTVAYHGTREDKYHQEIARIESIMNLARAMGIRKFRSDVCSGAHPLRKNTPEQFEEDFPTFVRAIRELADYAASIGLSVTLENHGLYVNGADRLIRLLRQRDLGASEAEPPSFRGSFFHYIIRFCAHHQRQREHQRKRAFHFFHPFFPHSQNTPALTISITIPTAVPKRIAFTSENHRQTGRSAAHTAKAFKTMHFPRSHSAPMTAPATSAGRTGGRTRAEES